MKTLKEHNDEIAERDNHLKSIADKSGVACDKCGMEMVLEMPRMMNLGIPPSQWVKCPKCGARGLKHF